MTKIGASITNLESIKAAKEIFTNFANIDELQAIASKRISKHLNAEAAVITASAAAGLSESVASMMTGNDLKKIFKLPNTNKMKNKVLIQKFRNGTPCYKRTFRKSQRICRTWNKRGRKING